MLENKLYKESCDEVLLSRGNDKDNRTVINIEEVSVLEFLQQLQKEESYPLNTDNIDRIIDLTKEKYHRMPSGLTREERRLWARSIKTNT